MTLIIVAVAVLAIILIILFIYLSKRNSTKDLETLEKETIVTKKEETSKPKKRRVENRPVSRPLKSRNKTKTKPIPVKEEEVKVEPVKQQPKVEVKPVKEEPKVEIKPKAKQTLKDYPEFNNARAIEQLGLSQEEADMFISELIDQINNEISGLEDAINSADYEKAEGISHMIKGSATSLGSGGVADVLVDLNTDIKEGNTDPANLQSHMENLKRYLIHLKTKFG